MAIYNEAWFVHQLSDAVVHLAQQKRSKTTGTYRSKEGVVGKTWPFNRLASQDMEEVTSRDSDTTYLNPGQSKRRAVLRDFNAAVLLDEFDQVKELPNPESEFTQMLAYARERQKDKLALSVPGRTAAGAAGTGTGGAIGKATTVDEAAETTSTGDMLATQQIVNGGTNLTMSKIRDAGELFQNVDADDEDKYFFYSPSGMKKLLTDSTVTSSDYSSINALSQGIFPMDAMWMGYKWRLSNRLPKSGNIRSCIAYARMGVGFATSAIKEIQVGPAPHKWNNWQAIAKYTGGMVRVDDNLVVQIDIDETA